MILKVEGFRWVKVPLLLALILTGASCASDKGNPNEVAVSVDSLVSENGALQKSMTTAKQIFYSLPSPLETALILKRSGAAYNEDLLNKVDNVSKYTTNRSMALNLGIYSTDLSYASLFDQTQATIKFMTASKKMAEGLGILNAIDDNIVQRLEENVNNRDVIMEIISETFLNTNSTLEENDRAATGSIILVGGWIEGLYLATQLVKDVKNADSELVQRIIDQKLSLVTVLSLLEQYNSNSDVQQVLTDVRALKSVFDEIEITISDVEIIPGKSGAPATLKSKSEISIKPDSFNKLKGVVNQVRTKYIQ